MSKKKEDIRKLVTETKTKDYGDPVESMSYCAKFWTLTLERAGILKEGKVITPRLACSMMIMFKQSRDIGIQRNENIRDTQGYAEIQKIEAERKKDEKPK